MRLWDSNIMRSKRKLISVLLATIVLWHQQLETAYARTDQNLLSTLHGAQIFEQEFAEETEIEVKEF